MNIKVILRVLISTLLHVIKVKSITGVEFSSHLILILSVGNSICYFVGTSKTPLAKKNWIETKLSMSAARESEPVYRLSRIGRSHLWRQS